MRASDPDTLGGLLMTSSSAEARTTLGRRDLVKASAVAAAGALTGNFAALPAAAQEPGIAAQEHWVNKGSVKLYLYRKRHRWRIGHQTRAFPGARLNVFKPWQL